MSQIPNSEPNKDLSPLVAAKLEKLPRQRLMGSGSMATRWTLEELFEKVSLKSPPHAQCCLAAMHLAHNDLDGGHVLCQDIENTEGSYWHGIMHRREPDYDNAKYWFRLVGRHGIFPALVASVKNMPACQSNPALSSLAKSNRWDPNLFIDLCSQANEDSNESLRRFCLDVQHAEWKLLFTHCYRLATGAK